MNSPSVWNVNLLFPGLPLNLKEPKCSFCPLNLSNNLKTILNLSVDETSSGVLMVSLIIPRPEVSLRAKWADWTLNSSSLSCGLQICALGDGIPTKPSYSLMSWQGDPSSLTHSISWFSGCPSPQKKACRVGESTGISWCCWKRPWKGSRLSPSSSSAHLFIRYLIGQISKGSWPQWSFLYSNTYSQPWVTLRETPWWSSPMHDPPGSL